MQILTIGLTNLTNDGRVCAFMFYEVIMGIKSAAEFRCALSQGYDLDASSEKPSFRIEDRLAGPIQAIATAVKNEAHILLRRIIKDAHGFLEHDFFIDFDLQAGQDSPACEKVLQLIFQEQLVERVTNASSLNFGARIHGNMQGDYSSSPSLNTVSDGETVFHFFVGRVEPPSTKFFLNNSFDAKDLPCHAEGEDRIVVKTTNGKSDFFVVPKGGAAHTAQRMFNENRVHLKAEMPGLTGAARRLELTNGNLSAVEYRFLDNTHALVTPEYSFISIPGPNRIRVTASSRGYVPTPPRSNH